MVAKSGCSFTPKNVNSGIFTFISYASLVGFGSDTKIIGRSDNALTFNTHAAWNIGIEGKELELPKDFASQKIMEITGAARKMYNPTTYELVYRVE